jgi:hypothetical protein
MAKDCHHLRRITFSPMTQYHFADETIRAWCYQDRIMLRLILSIIKKTFKHIIPKRCYHMQGPPGVSDATKTILALTILWCVIPSRA